MSYQSILVHVDDAERVVVRLGAAARLARSFDAELIGAYVVPAPTLTPALSAVLPDRVVEQRLQEMGEAQAAAEALFRAAAKRARLSAVEWRAPAGDAIAAVVEHARCTDLAIVGQRDPDDTQAGFSSELADALIFSVGRPVLVVPFASAPVAFGKTALVSWNGSRESARAVADAMPMLARAEKVHLLAFDAHHEESVVETHADQRLMGWLRFHGIDAVARHLHHDGKATAELILSQVADLGADLLVMGAHSHSGLRAMVRDSVTQLVMEQSTVPVLLSR